MPPAPLTFSMTTCWPRTSDRRTLRMRAMLSEALPAANGTTIVSGRIGQSCAVASCTATADAITAAMVRKVK